MQFVLGLDGGGTGCRAVLEDRAGRRLGQGEAGPANIASHPEAARAAILAAAAAALGPHPAGTTAAVLGLAGANIAAAQARISAGLPFGRARVLHDAVTSVAGALGPDDGIVAAIGTGSVFSRQISGEVLTIGGWGPVLGDEASGAWIGRRMLAEAIRAGDGLGPATPLGQALLDGLGGPDGAVAFARTATAADFAALAPRVLAAPDDPAAAAVLAAAEAHVVAAVERLREGRALPVVFLGGLGPAFARRLAARWPQRAALGTGLDGALRLAHQLAGEPA